MEVTTITATATALTVAIVQIVKGFNLDTRFLPVVALVAGIGAMALVTQSFTPLTILDGVISGLTAMGLWTGSKVVITGRA